MHAARKNGLILSIIGILTRLYLLSGAAVVIVLLANILGFLRSATYAYQVLGAMIVTGGIWFLAILISSILSVHRGHQSEFAQFSGTSTGTTRLNRIPSPLEMSDKRVCPEPNKTEYHVSETTN